MKSSASHGRGVTPFRDFRASPVLTDEVIFNVLSSINSPRSLTVWLLYSSKTEHEHDQLTELECLPVHYLEAFKFRDDYLATSLLSKATFLTTSFDKKEVALKKFFKFEELCRTTNDRLRNLASDPLLRSDRRMLNATRVKIASILGDFDGEEFVEEADWGPGVTTLLKGSYVSAINKFHLENGITR